MSERSDGGRAAAIGCRAHTGWAALVVVGGSIPRPDVILRRRVELRDPTGQVRPNAFQRARSLDLPAAAELVAAAERIALERATVALEETSREVVDVGAVVGSCAVVVGASHDAPLESILASHALAHAAEGRLYERALLQGAESGALTAVAVPKRSIWERGEETLGVAADDLRVWIDQLRRELGPPWAEDQKLAALAAWIALAPSS